MGVRSRELGNDQKDMLVNVTGNSEGFWYPLNMLHPVHVTVRGTFNATVRIFVDNMSVQPATSDDAGAQWGTDITSPTSTVIDAGTVWIKVAVFNYISGTINAGIVAG